jgi:hypothetical protein
VGWIFLTCGVRGIKLFDNQPPHPCALRCHPIKGSLFQRAPFVRLPRLPHHRSDVSFTAIPDWRNYSVQVFEYGSRTLAYARSIWTEDHRRLDRSISVLAKQRHCSCPLYRIYLGLGSPEDYSHPSTCAATNFAPNDIRAVPIRF